MKLETTARILRSALETAGRLTAKRASIPVLSSVLFDDNKVVGTDLDTQISVTIPARKAKGRVCLPASTLLTIIKHLSPDEDVSIAAGNEGATLSFSAGRYDLPKIDAADFPLLAQDAVFEEVRADGEKLKKAMDFVAPFASTEETRYYLNGVCIAEDNAVATDGHRMGIHPLGFDGGAFKRAIIQNAAAYMMLRLPSPKSVGLSANRLVMDWKCAGASIRTKLIDGTFPDYTRVIPAMSGNSIKVRFERAALLNSARRISSIPGIQGVRLAWDEHSIALASSANYADVSIREHVPLIEATAPGGASFNVRYVARMLGTLKAEAIDLWQADQGAPIVCRGDESEGYVLIMPMRADDADAAAASALLDELRKARKREAA